jgi:5-formyltetrahydrofolate cyclo-ligase
MSDPKPLLRNEMKRRRAALATAQPFAGDHLAQAVAADLNERRDWPDHHTIVAGYYPIQSEINPFPLMQAFANRGHALCLPCLVPGESGFRMIFRRFSIGEDLVHGPFDIRQPADHSEEVDPDVVMVPLLAFNRAGVRLGYGGGYYDRALERLRAQKVIRAVGIAFSGQEVAQIPFEVHDQPLDGIFTELGLTGAEPTR